MVEGHGVHRVAEAHKKILIGHYCLAISPNGRFKEGATKIDGKYLHRIEAHGKNLFYFFFDHKLVQEPSNQSEHQQASTDDEADLKLLVVHIHFGMSGQFNFVPYPNEEEVQEEEKLENTKDQQTKRTRNLKIDHEKTEELSLSLTSLHDFVKPTTRLQLLFPKIKIALHLSCQTLDYGDIEFYNDWVNKRLGPDPIRMDADFVVFKANVVNYNNKSIGQALMDQKVVAGIGNIYRAEILFKSKVHPSRSCSTLSDEEFGCVWKHSVECLKRGVETGSIITVDTEDAERLGHPWTRRYIYNQTTCGECQTKVKSWDMKGRTCYCCETCQPLDTTRIVNETGEMESERILKKMENLKVDQDNLEYETLSIQFKEMNMKQLKQQLMSLGLSPKGNRKKQLIERLIDHSLQLNIYQVEHNISRNWMDTKENNLLDQDTLENKTPPPKDLMTCIPSTPVHPRVHHYQNILPATSTSLLSSSSSNIQNGLKSNIYSGTTSLLTPPQSPLHTMTVEQLKKELKMRELSVKGKKKDLITRLQESITITSENLKTSPDTCSLSNLLLDNIDEKIKEQHQIDRPNKNLKTKRSNMKGLSLFSSELKAGKWHKDFYQGTNDKDENESFYPPDSPTPLKNIPKNGLLSSDQLKIHDGHYAASFSLFSSDKDHDIDDIKGEKEERQEMTLKENDKFYNTRQRKRIKMTMTGISEAVKEKMNAGEKKNVEHVALVAHDSVLQKIDDMMTIAIDSTR